ncbi:O-antigen polymerase [Pseudomonas sp.]|uniref:O-antigen polymerase n=1 Tax=Pseudomonas sp. TaxID=306 RepID=UPI003A96D3EB
MEDLDKFFALLYSGLILLNACVIRYLVGSWVFPACLFLLFWFFMTFFPLVVIWNAPVNPLVVGFIALLLFFFSFSSLFFDWRSAYKISNDLKSGVKFFESKFLHIVFYMCAICSILFVFLQVLSVGFTLRDLVFNFFDVASGYATKRYAGDLDNGIYSKSSLSFAYLSVLVGGLIYSVRDTKIYRMLILGVAFLPSILVMVFQSSKGLFFLSIALFFGSVLVSRFFSDRVFLLDKKSLFFAIKAALVAFPLVVISFLSRGLYNESADYAINRVLRYLYSYSSGHLYAFSDWFSNYVGDRSVLSYKDVPLTYGFYTFASFFRFAGDDRVVPMGTYDEYYDYNDQVVSNIFTMFRGLITDFGFFGSLVAFAVFGLFVNLVFYVFLRSRKPVFTTALFVFFVGFFYMSYIISFLTWAIIPFVFVLFSIVLVVNKILGGRSYG